MDAGELSLSLRQLILLLYDRFLSEDGNEVDYEGLARSDEWGFYRKRTVELRRIDIRKLNRQEKVRSILAPEHL